jgi:hypothetical protein
MHRLFLSLVTSFALAAAATIPNNLPFTFLPAGNCSLSQAALDLPAGQNNLTVPAGQHVSAVTVGFGVQNYTCNSTSQTWSSVGAVVQVLDTSCLLGQPELSNIQDDVFSAWNAMPSSITIQDVIGMMNDCSIVLGQHYFIADPGNPSQLDPVWDFRPSIKGDPNAFVVAAVIGDLPAPTSPDDVDWLELKGVQGDLANFVFRVDTKSGQPPASCSAGDAPISVKFATQYWLMKGGQ